MPYQSEFTGAQIDERLAQVLPILEELVAARGGRSTLAARLLGMSEMGTPGVGGFVPGRFYDQATTGASSGTQAYGANRLEVSPFIVSRPLNIDQIGVQVTTANAGQGRMVIYGTGADGWPDARLFQSAGTIDTGATGYRFVAESFSFDPHRLYWIGVHTSAGPTLATLSAGATKPFGLASAIATGAAAYATSLRQTVTFANGAPANWGFAASHLQTGVTASIRMRAAA